MKILLLVTILAVLCIVNTNCAVMRSEEFAEQIRRIVEDGYVGDIKHRPTENTNEEQRECYNNPCGWFTYNPTAPGGLSFMRNTCRCPDETYKCVRTGEIVSMPGHVYHCHQNTTVDDIELEEDAS